MLDQTAHHNAESLGIVEGIDEADGQRRIHGVVRAVRTARRTAIGHEHGLHEVLMSVRNQVSKNLRALYDCYEASTNTDLDGKDQLDAAPATVAHAHYR